MNCIEAARAAIAQSPLDPEHMTLARLLHALEAGEPFELDNLYDLQFDRFELAMGMLREWRLARYYAGRRTPVLADMAQRADLAAAGLA